MLKILSKSDALGGVFSRGFSHFCEDITFDSQDVEEINPKLQIVMLSNDHDTLSRRYKKLARFHTYHQLATGET